MVSTGDLAEHYLLFCALVTKVFVLQILTTYHNLEDLEFEDPLDGSLLDVSYLICTSLHGLWYMKVYG